jgi:hypothetical protein
MFTKTHIYIFWQALASGSLLTRASLYPKTHRKKDGSYPNEETWVICVCHSAHMISYFFQYFYVLLLFLQLNMGLTSITINVQRTRNSGQASTHRPYRNVQHD